MLQAKSVNNLFFSFIENVGFFQEKSDLRGGLLLLFHWKKTAAEILVEAYGEHMLYMKFIPKSEVVIDKGRKKNANKLSL